MKRSLSLARLTLARLTLASVLIASLGACAVVPAQPAGYGYGYRPAPVYVETYPTYRYDVRGGYYQDNHRHHDNRNDGYYRDNRRYEDTRRNDSPFDDAARMHRDIRRSLGLPRLPGMP